MYSFQCNFISCDIFRVLRLFANKFDKMYEWIERTWSAEKYEEKCMLAQQMRWHVNDFQRTDKMYCGDILLSKQMESKNPDKLHTMCACMCVANTSSQPTWVIT